MTENALTVPVDTTIVERVVMQGDLSKLTSEERLEYYRQVCASMGLNPLTRPFDYIDLHGKLTLYAKRDAADQLRKLHGISIDKPDVTIQDDLVMVSVTGRDKTGRTDSELGVVYLGRKSGDDKANAILKAITKAKRRLTLSIVGLGWLDETEVDTIPGAQHEYPPEHRAAIDDAAELAEAQRESEGVETESPPIDLDYLPDWLDSEDTGLWGQLRAEAVTWLGYSHENHVKNTLKKVLAGDAAHLNYRTAWNVLVEHQRSKQAEQEGE